MFSFLFLSFLILVTVYLSLMYQSTSVMLLAFGEVLYFVVSFFLLFLRRFSIRCELDVPIGISEAGKKNMIRMKLINRGPFSVHRMKVQIVTMDILRGTKKKSWMTLSGIPRGESSFQQSIQFSATGNYTILLRKLRIYDPSGLMYADIRTKSSRFIQVTPPLYDVPIRLTLAVRNFYGEADVYDEHSSGPDHSELFQVREYQPGDRLQNVHWKLTAKQDTLMVKEHSLPKSCPVLLFLNFHPKKFRKKQTPLIPYMTAAASLSFSLMDAGCPHYVIWHDAATGDVVRLRVDDEESLFYFIGTLMKIVWQTPKEELLVRYQEKYGREPYVRTLSLDETLLLKKDGEELVRFRAKTLEQSLSQIELLL